jgi:signal transduction histidine kinase
MNARCEGVTAREAAPRESRAEQLARSVGALAEMVKTILAADACVIAMENASPSNRVYGVPSALAEGPEANFAKLGTALLDLPAEPMVFSRLADCRSAGERSTTGLALVARLLRASSIVCLPLRLPAAKARLCVAKMSGRYTRKDLPALTAFTTQVLAVLESIHFGERLAIELARQERRQISRDLHDSAIQPYIGLKLGLEALRRRLGKEHALAADAEELIAIAAAGAGELRQYVGALKTSTAKRKTECLLSAVRSEARKFGALYGIEASVVAAGEISVPPPMQHEVIQMIREGLSNVRRHTTADRATIHLRQDEGKLLLEIINDSDGDGGNTCRFSPRSIGERATELGGRVRAERRGRHTVVAVELPI